MNWIVDPTRLAEFLLAATLVELTPGPNMGYLAIVAASQGRRAGLMGVAGATLGLSIYMAAAAFGLADVVVGRPLIYTTLRWTGVAYLLWLAGEAWFRASGPRPPPGAPSGRAFVRSLSANLLNIKAALFYVVVLPSFIDPARGSVLEQALILGSLHIALSLVAHTAIVLGASSFRGVARRPRRRALDRAFAIAIAATAVWLAWETRR